jgi:hypothetical protein
MELEAVDWFKTRRYMLMFGWVTVTAEQVWSLFPEAAIALYEASERRK